MVRADVAATRVARALAWLSDAESLFSRAPDELVADPKGRDLALFYLFLAIQKCIDLAAQWVADAGWEPADDAGAAFDILANRGALDEQAAGALRAATGLRNRIAHGYAMLDYRRVQEESRLGIPALRRFLLAVAHAAGVE